VPLIQKVRLYGKSKEWKSHCMLCVDRDIYGDDKYREMYLAKKWSCYAYAYGGKKLLLGIFFHTIKGNQFQKLSDSGLKTKYSTKSKKRYMISSI
jgi:hypothetical protein